MEQPSINWKKKKKRKNKFIVFFAINMKMAMQRSKRKSFRRFWLLEDSLYDQDLFLKSSTTYEGWKVTKFTFLRSVVSCVI